MRRWQGALIGLVAAAGIGLARLAAAPPEGAPATAEPAAAAEAPAPEERVVHTFKDEQELQRFVELWQQRQGILVRLSVLQAYVGEEQAGLAELQRQLGETYHLNLQALDRTVIDLEKRVIVERAQPPAPPAPVQEGVSAP
jgi:hypothetical protein